MAGKVRVVRVLVATAVLPLAIAVGGALLVWSWRDELPDSVAMHWGVDGTANGFGSPLNVAVVIAGFGVVFAVLGLVLELAMGRGIGADVTVSRAIAAILTGTTAFVAVVATWLTALQRGLDDANAAPMSGAAFFAGTLAGGVAALAAAWMVPPRDGSVVRIDVDPNAPRVPLPDDQPVSWTRSVASGSGLVVAVIVGMGLSAIMVIVLGQWWLLALTVALAFVVLALLSIRVRVDESGLWVRGRLGWPRSNFPLDRIGQARTQTVRPLRDFGGYGYRVAAFGTLRGARGYVTRAGDALVVDLTDGGTFVVVVDDAVTAAGLLNSLVERQRAR